MKTEERVDIRLRVDPDFHGKVQAIADSEQTTVAAYIRGLIVADMKRRQREGVA